MTSVAQFNLMKWAIVQGRPHQRSCKKASVRHTGWANMKSALWTEEPAVRMGRAIQAGQFSMRGGSQEGLFWSEEELNKLFKQSCWHDN